MLYLIPVFEWKCWKRCSVGKLKVCKVPVKNLSVSRRQINITEIEIQKDITWTPFGRITGMLWSFSTAWYDSAQLSTALARFVFPLQFSTALGRDYLHVIIVAPPLMPWLLNFFLIPHRSIEFSLDPLLGSEWEERLYFLNRQWNKRGALIQSSWVPSFAGCTDLNLAGLLCLLPQFKWRRQWRFSQANQRSTEYTHHVSVTGMLGTSPEVVKKKKVPGTVPSGKKSQKWAAPNLTMQWKSTINVTSVGLFTCMGCIWLPGWVSLQLLQSLL